ncbi:MAG: anaerobic ribonucleoside-triphosphate reductase activating protein [Proteobacteria bacterium]|nr:anaerobic ribonucleoside-triphosphate reductase activating protein [Pseudomonadota bacterium]
MPSDSTSAKPARSATSEPAAARLRIGGFVPFSTLDYPGEIAAVVFCQGCMFRCGYCQNPHLVPDEGPEAIPWAEVRERVARRAGFIDAVVFSGGEPMRQPGPLAAAMREVRALGFRIGLQTNGHDPEALATLLPLADWVGLDVKAPPALYERVTGVKGSGPPSWESVRRVLASGVAAEFRTTVDPRVLGVEDVVEIGHGLLALGIGAYVLQEMRTGPMLSAEPLPAGAPAAVLLAAYERLRPLMHGLSLRRA